MEKLVGREAFEHPAVRSWWKWLRDEWNGPEKPIVVLLPCSRRKPYTKQPLYRKITVLLKWDGTRSLTHILFISDLLALVPEERAEEFPACCYDVSPSFLRDNPDLRAMVVEALAGALPKLVGRVVIAMLSWPHRVLLEDALRLSGVELGVRYTPYNLRWGHRRLAEEVRRRAKRLEAG